jgi:phosphate transport system substrate-binding protein
MQMKKAWIFGLTTVVLMAGGIEDFKGQNGTLRIAGGTAHIPIMKIISEEVAQAAPDLKIAIAGGGSGVGIKKVGEGLVDIGNAGRKASDKEIAKYGLILHKWAIDGIAVVLNPQNSITNLSKEQIKQIFAGKISNWKAVGGNDQAINIYTRDKASGTRKVFWKKVLDKGDIDTKALFVKSNGAMKRSVQGDLAAIGFMSAGFVDQSVQAVSIDGVAPSTANIQEGSYIFVRGLYSITKGEPEGTVKTFIEYLTTPHVQHDIVAKKGFIPVK